MAKYQLRKGLIPKPERCIEIRLDITNIITHPLSYKSKVLKAVTIVLTTSQQR